MVSKFATLAVAYIQFMSTVGSVSDQSVYVQELPAIFSEHVTKVENGKVIVKGHQELLYQLKTARSFAYPWKMEILDVVADNDNSTAAVRFTWNSEKVGLHITTAILKFNKEDKITEINEVYNKFADITH